MAQQFSEISDKLTQFINDQKIFFVGTATESGRINISPKGMDSLCVINKNRVIWLNVTGSGNETSAHIQNSPRMTLMFTSFEENPIILRLYGEAKVIHKNDLEWSELINNLKPLPGARQIFDLSVDLVQTSCGMATPLYDYVGDRDLLNNWANKKGNSGIQSYWKEKNQISIDGIATNIVNKNSE